MNGKSSRYENSYKTFSLCILYILDKLVKLEHLDACSQGQVQSRVADLAGNNVYEQPNPLTENAHSTM